MNHADEEQPRRRTRAVRLGTLQVGGGAPVSIQSMTTTSTRDTVATGNQIRRLVAAGCEVIRVAVPDEEAVAALPELKRISEVPLVADIHFDHRLAVAALDTGVDGLRINPGNIGTRQGVREIVRAAAGRQTPIRVGANSGSLPRDILDRYGGVTPRALVETALRHVALLEESGHEAIKISVKASDMRRTVDACRLLARRVDHPQHIGVTEAGVGESAIIRSVLGIGLLLNEGIGDTIRVSLTGDPVREIGVARGILQDLGLRSFGPVIHACPGCARIHAGDAESFAGMVERIAEGVKGLHRPLRLAVMGCEVNGPGEAREADLGVALGRNGGVLFRGGEPVRKIPLESLVDEFVVEACKLDLSNPDNRRP